MGSRNTNPLEVIPGEDVFHNVVNPGDTIAMATKSYGSAHINKGRYLGQRKPMNYYSEDFRCYIVEQDLVRRERTHADGQEWLHYGYGKTKEVYDRQRAALTAAVGEDPGYYFKGNQYRYGSPEYTAAEKVWNASYKDYCKRRDAWLDEHYPWKSTPYVRRSTLWLNKIIKL